MQNTPDLWLENFPFPKPEQHKYNRGHVVVSGGGIDSTGAACLAANAALRIGAGLVTVASPKDAMPVYAVKLTSVMAKPFSDIRGFKELISDKRKNVVLLGPGGGLSEYTAEKVMTALSLGKSYVIDADAITVFKDRKEELFHSIKSPVVLTPHEGEFAALFGYNGNRYEMAKEASYVSGAVIVLKGHETIIASPDGRTAINNNAPPSLATAGSGDVLAGMIAGLMAQGMEAFKAASCAVWMHGKAAELLGLGLISEDLPGKIPAVLQYLHVIS